MIIINNLDEFNNDMPSAIAIGKFDGIHQGHNKLINKIKDKSKEGLRSVVFTFDTSAANFFSSEKIMDIMTIEEKRLAFERMGIDVLVEFHLTKETAATPPLDFIEKILVNNLSMKYICAGDDISYGAMGKGDAKLLKDMSEKYNYEVDIIDKLYYCGREISSTYVREEILKGNMKTVSDLLGHPYSFIGRVENGFKLGHKLGMPTLNQYPDERKILPPLGVYYSRVSHRGCIYKGITNIGKRPTVSNNERISVETYLYDFDMDIYGDNIETFLLDFKRPEMKFSSVEDLKAQMNLDLLEGKEYV